LREGPSADLKAAADERPESRVDGDGVILLLGKRAEPPATQAALDRRRVMQSVKLPLSDDTGDCEQQAPHRDQDSGLDQVTAQPRSLRIEMHRDHGATDY